LVANLCAIQPQTITVEGNKSAETIMEELSKKLLAQIPEPWDLEKFEEKYPTI
jgi:hypothetical protein